MAGPVRMIPNAATMPTVIEATIPAAVTGAAGTTTASAAPKTPLRGALVIGGTSLDDIKTQLEALKAKADAGNAPAPAPPAEEDLRAPHRLAIDVGQLLTSRIYLVEVGVSHQLTAFSGVSHKNVGLQSRHHRTL